MDNVVRDLRHAIRSLARTPAFTIVVIVTLALGIGANTAIFTVVNAVLLRPLAYSEPAQLVVLEPENESTVTPGTFSDWSEKSRSFERMAAAEYWTPSLTTTDQAREITGLHVTTDIFPLLGVRPLIGRTFRQDEQQAGHDRVVVISHSLWIAHFAGDSGILARSLRLNGETYSIVGVMPRDFVFAPYWATNALLWAPMSLAASRNDFDRSSLRVFARMKRGVTEAAAARELTDVSALLESERGRSARKVAVTGLQEKVTGGVRDRLLIMLVAVVLVLLIACANVAHLQLIRAATRQREFGLRSALGASRRRLLAHALSESAVLAFIGATLGLLLAYGGVRALVAIAPPDIPRLSSIKIDWKVLVYIITASALSALLAGVWPAITATRVNVDTLIREGGRTAGESRSRKRSRAVIVGSEFALAVLLLVGAGLVGRSFLALNTLNPGFDPEHVLSLVVSTRATGSADPLRRSVFFETLLNDIRVMPGVRSASAVNHLPLHGDNWRFRFAVEGTPYTSDDARPKAIFRVVSAGYFSTMRIPLLSGHEYGGAEDAGDTKRVIINEYMARQHWPDQDPIGRRLTLSADRTTPGWYTVVGVAANVKQSSWSAPSAEEMYFPALDARRSHPDSVTLAGLQNPSTMTLVVRTDGAAAAMTSAIERTVWSFERNAAISSVITVSDAIGEQLSTPRFYALLMSVFAGLALLLATLGAYGVVSYSVSRRTREIGVRLALGAQRADTFRMIVREGMTVAGLGTSAGIGLAMLGTRFIRALLYGVTGSDPATFIIVPCVLVLAAFVASALPARRATRVDPLAALRAD